jgi:membrane protein YdbS with pleckstrin-like domain
VSDQPTEPTRPAPEAPRTPAPSTPSGPGAVDPREALGEEKELWQGRMSWKRFVGSAALWVVGTVVLIWLWLKLRQQWGPWLGKAVWLLIVAAAGVLFVRAAIKVYGRRYRLTSQRMFIERGILGRTTDQTELIRVDDVRTYQSLTDRIFGLGDVELISTDATEPNSKAEGIAGPHEVAEYVRSYTRALRTKRSLFVEHL